MPLNVHIVHHFEKYCKGSEKVPRWTFARKFVLTNIPEHDKSWKCFMYLCMVSVLDIFWNQYLFQRASHHSQWKNHRFQQLNSEFSHMNHSHELSELNLQAGVCEFSIVKDRRLLGMDTRLRIDPKPIPYTDILTVHLEYNFLSVFPDI